LDVHLPDPIISAIGHRNQGPETDAMLADSVGLALLVVLEKLEPPERLAFVLHDVFRMTWRIQTGSAGSICRPSSPES
jgi:RNA polymerase sigma-70 factor (ECF subfamily)